MHTLRRSTPFLALLLLPFNGRCQQPFPTYADSGVWSVLQCITGIDTWCFTETATYEYTDTLCGYAWSIHSWPTFGTPGTAYIRNEGQRTLLKRSSNCLAKEYVLYDYSLEVGDSVYVPLNMDWNDPDTTLFFLQSIDTVEILGVERRRFSLHFDSCSTGVADAEMQWIEGIGSTTDPFYGVHCFCDWCQQYMDLLCYDSSGVQLYVDPAYNTCDTLITAIDELDGEHENILQVMHDAAAGSLYVTVGQDIVDKNRSGLALLLLASDGRIVRRQGLSASASSGVRMDVASVASGAYVLLLTDGRERLAGQRVVIH